MKRYLAVMTILACFCAAPCIATAQSSVPQQPSVTVPTNIHLLYLDDQADRTVGGFVPKYGPDVNSRDTVRRAEAKSLLEAGDLKTAQDFHDAAFIFQHGHDPDDYLLAHILAIQAIIQGDASSKWIAAATLDRYLQSVGREQVFGTQYLTKGYSYILQHKDDPHAEQSPEAQQKGMTQEPYDRTLISEALRSEFGVPGQVAQTKKLDEMNAKSQ